MSDDHDDGDPPTKRLLVHSYLYTRTHGATCDLIARRFGTANDDRDDLPKSIARPHRSSSGLGTAFQHGVHVGLEEEIWSCCQSAWDRFLKPVVDVNQCEFDGVNTADFIILLEGK